ncbi:MAG TPA: IscS subfamily cysteine desulfurase [Pseudomonadales bacterium]|nr:IscS subfamily cysteine desulfurase [Pseudomonadales bacterium]
MKRPVYLDYAATTPVDPRVAEKMMGCLTLDGVFGNPASRSHLYGWQAEEAVENARIAVAELVNCDPREIVWTSGATEADNLALKGVAHFHRRKGNHIITSKIEHKAVLDSCRQLELEGFEVTYLTPEAGSGLIHPEAVAAALREDTILVSLMHVNNEIGTVTDIAAIGELTRARGVLFHVDAAQSAGKLPIDLSAQAVDLMSFSGHKLYGPKGVGALYVRRVPKASLEAQIHGGGHERGMRSGTLPTHQVVGMGEAFALARQEAAQDRAHLERLRAALWHGIHDLDGLYLNGHPEQRVPGILNIGFAGVDGEALLMALKDLAVSTGSACNSASVDPSYVLKGIGLSDVIAQASLRFSMGRFTTAEEIDFAVERIRDVVTKLRR